MASEVRAFARFLRDPPHRNFDPPPYPPPPLYTFRPKMSKILLIFQQTSRCLLFLLPGFFEPSVASLPTPHPHHPRPSLIFRDFDPSKQKVTPHHQLGGVVVGNESPRGTYCELSTFPARRADWCTVQGSTNPRFLPTSC